MVNIEPPPIVLTIAGSDSSAGAGLQADLKTLAALGVYGATVVTALTAQNTQQVAAVWPVPDGAVAGQLAAVLADLRVSAVKIGMLHRDGVIAEVVTTLQGLPDIPVICDTVMTSTTGAVLLDEDAIERLKTQLIPLTDVITPNLREAALLLGDVPMAENEQQMIEQAEALMRLGGKGVLLTGGHLAGDQARDVLVWRDGDRQRCEIFRTPWIHSKNTHGTGCTLSSAIAAEMAKGQSLPDAVMGAKEYVTGALAYADELAVGQGAGPLNHFYLFQQRLAGV